MKAYEVNTKSAFLCAKAVAPAMNQQGKGSIINIGSISGRGKKERADMAAYGTAKAAVMNLTITWRSTGARKFASTQSRRGSLTRHDRRGESTGTHSPRALKRISLGRAGTADEVASVALFLAADAASYVSGAIIDVNGGE